MAQQNARARLDAFAVSEGGERDYWTRIGCAFENKDSEGYTVLLDALPVNGKIVLRAPRDPDERRDQRRERR
jgi:hypothetical protein